MSLYAFEFKKDETSFRVSFYSTPWTGDCGTKTLSCFSASVVGRSNISDSDKRKLVAFALRVAAWPGGTYSREYKKFVASFAPRNNPTYMGTAWLSKVLRFRTIKAKSAHGGHPFRYGIKEFDCSKLAPLPKGFTLVDVKQSNRSMLESIKRAFKLGD